MGRATDSGVMLAELDVAGAVVGVVPHGEVAARWHDGVVVRAIRSRSAYDSAWPRTLMNMT